MRPSRRSRVVVAVSQGGEGEGGGGGRAPPSPSPSSSRSPSPSPLPRRRSRRFSEAVTPDESDGGSLLLPSSSSSRVGGGGGSSRERPQKRARSGDVNNNDDDIDADSANADTAGAVMMTMGSTSASASASASASSSSSSSSSTAGDKPIHFSSSCPHVDTAVRFARIRRKMTDPSRWSCCECGSTGTVWACLECGRMHCGRYAEGHAEDHFDGAGNQHPLVIDVNEDIVHCYACDAYVANDNEAQELTELRRMLQTTRQEQQDMAFSSDADDEAQQRFSKLDKLQTILRRWQHVQLAKAFGKWRAVCLAKRAGGKDTSMAPPDASMGRQDSHMGRLDTVVNSRVESRANLAGSGAALIRAPTASSLVPPSPRNATFEQMRLRRALAWGMIQERSADSHFVPGQAGLRNVGNTCFMNSVLQALSYLPEMRDFFINVLLPAPAAVARPTSTLARVAELHESRAAAAAAAGTVRIGSNTFSRQGTIECLHRTQQRSIPPLEQISVCMQLHELLRVLWSGRWAVVTPWNLHQALQKFVPKFRGYKQQDAQEFLCYLLDRVHTELVTDPEPSVSGGSDSIVAPVRLSRSAAAASRSEKAAANSLAAIGRQSIVTDLFQGKILSRVRCHRCGDVSSTVDETLDLQLRIPERFVRVGRARRSRARSVEPAPEMEDETRGCMLSDLLDEFTRAEQLPEKARYCEKCRSYEDAEKWMTLDSAPNVVCIIVNRFYFTATSRAKISTDIDFPLRGLDLARYATEGEADHGGRQRASGRPAQELYDLMSIVVHHGASVASGHYTAFCWNPELDTWYHYNDARVMAVSEDEVSKAQPYVMFYEKRELNSAASVPAGLGSRTAQPKLQFSRRRLSPAPKNSVFSAGRAEEFLRQRRSNMERGHP